MNKAEEKYCDFKGSLLYSRRLQGMVEVNW